MSDAQDKTYQKNKFVKATQIAFELEQDIALKIRILAAQEGLTPSDQIRKLIGLSYSPPKRPRLTISLTNQDYKILGKKYNIDPSRTIEIKKRIIADLFSWSGENH